MRLKFLAFAITVAALIAYPFSPSQAATSQEQCPRFNFADLFVADYTTGSHWDNGGGNLQITWSAKESRIYDEEAVRPFTDTELGWIRTAFQSWDLALNTVSFVEVEANAYPEIVIGYVPLKPSAIQPNAIGFWNAWIANNFRYHASIKLKASELSWFGKGDQFTHTVQHELGNVLGLGDLNPTPTLESVFEDPWQPPYGRSQLSNVDIAMMRQLYNESTCTSTFTSPTSLSNSLTRHKSSFNKKT